MGKYKYKIIGQDGKTSEGVMEAKDKFSLQSQLKKEGNTVVSVEENTKSMNISLDNLLPFLGGISTHDKIKFARNLSQMMDAGLPMTRALSIMERQARSTFKNVLTGLGDSIAKGNSLGEAMKEYPKAFSMLFVSMVKAGEESGNISMALKNVAMQLEKSYQLSKKIRGALMYPSVILLLMIVIGVLMMVYMVPTLTATFVGLGIQLPLATRIIIAISNFLQSYFMFVIIGALVLGAGFFSFIKTKIGSRLTDFVLLHTPIIGEMVRQVNSARTARTLSSLLSAGVDIVIAFGVTKDVIQNSYYKEVLEKIKVTIQKGEQVSSIFIENQKLYPIFVGEMVAVGEETGKIGDMLVGVAQFYEEEIDQKTKDLSSVIEPFLMVFIGLAVGLFAIAIIGPIYSIGDGIK